MQVFNSQIIDVSTLFKIPVFTILYLMKHYLLIALFLVAYSTGFSQEKLPHLDAEKLQAEAMEIGAAGDYEKALEILQKVNSKDSLYCSTLISISYYQLNNGNLEEAIETTNKGLALDCPSEKLSFYINKGVSLLNLEKYEEAVQVFQEALGVYPRNAQLWFNLGRVLENQKKLEDAVSAYQNAILFNPAYAKPHLRLGDICYKQELFSQALMSYNMFLLLNPDGDDSFAVLKGLNELVKIKNPNKANPNLTISEDAGSFRQLDLILENKLALNDRYEVDADILIPLTRQNHLMLEQLALLDKKDGFWSNYYVPAYQWIWKKGLFEEFNYTINFSIENEKYEPMVAKRIKDIKEFIQQFYAEWFATIENSKMRNIPEDQGLSYTYESFQLNGVGQSVNGQKQGDWKFFRSNGSLSGEGSFDQNGNRTGEWKWYGDNGELMEYAFYKDGKLEGENKRFFENGKPYYVAPFINDKITGEYLVYNDHGALIQKKYFKEDKLEGAFTSNFSVGAKLPEFFISYKNGLIEGELTEMFASGITYSKRFYKNGKLEGPDKRYNRDGSLYSEINYKEGIPVGEYKTYYANGQLRESGIYQKGNFDGEFTTFYKNGIRESKSEWSKGKLHGTYSYFDRDGVLQYEYKYHQGNLIAFRFYDKSGKIIDEGKKKGGAFYFKGYTPYGQLDSEGNYDISGGKQGNWKYYSPNGILITEGEYQENMATGLHKTYYPTGEKESVQEYIKDTLQGYYAYFYLTGQLRQQGYYKDGQEHGEWRSYYVDGKLKSVNYYHKGSLNNLQEYFAVDGTLDYTETYKYGELVEETYYDENQKPYEIIDYTALPEGEYKLIKKHPDGSNRLIVNVLNGVKHGEFLEYAIDGTLLQKGYYVNGAEHGPWTIYYSNGKIKRELAFDRGEFHGDFKDYYESGAVERTYKFQYGEYEDTWISYYENGNIEVVTGHEAGKEHGRKEFYDPSGKFQALRYYAHGRLMGYTYPDKNEEELPLITIKNETGKMMAYFNNGVAAREMEFLNGELTGIYKSYYYSGQLESEIEYKSGERSGSFKVFYSNGNVKVHNNYRGGFLYGVSKEYFENGQLKREANYLNDKKHGEEAEYNVNGKVLSKKYYRNGDVYNIEIL